MENRYSSDPDLDEQLCGGLSRQITNITKTDLSNSDAIGISFNCGHTLLLSNQDYASLSPRPTIGDFFPCLHNACVSWLYEVEAEKEQEQNDQQGEFNRLHAAAHDSGDEDSCILPGIGEVRACTECGCLVAGGAPRCIMCEPAERVSLNDAHTTLANALEQDTKLLFLYQDRIAEVLHNELRVSDATLRGRVASIILASLFADMEKLNKLKEL